MWAFGYVRSISFGVKKKADGKPSAISDRINLSRIKRAEAAEEHTAQA